MTTRRDGRGALRRPLELIGIILLLASGCGRGEPVASAAATDDAPLPPLVMGTNLASVVDWSTDMAFVDVFKASREWIAQRPGGRGPWDTREPLDVTAQGWPRLTPPAVAMSAADPADPPFADHPGRSASAEHPPQAAATLMCREIHGRYPAGLYVVRYEGQGRLHFGMDARVIRESQGRIDLMVKPTHAGILMRIDETNPQDPIRNIRVTMPGFEDHDSPFHPQFLERLRPFKVIRFMDWQRTNDSRLERWADRTTPEHARQSRREGVALEYMIALANELKVDPWFTMPHLADDEYVQRFAEMVRDNLDPQLKVYIEYSNEVWNMTFRQARHAREQGLALGLSGDPYEAQLRYQSQRSVEMFRIWEDVFGGTDRLVRVMAAHHVNPRTSREVLSWRAAHQHVDALAVAPYFGHGVLENLGRDGDRAAAATVDEVIGLTVKSMANMPAQIAAQRAVADAFGVELIAYEGGQHLVGPRGGPHAKQLETLGAQANRDPRMYDLYARLFDAWHRHGGGLFATFSYVHQPARSGSWGLLEYVTQPIEDAPKYQAALDASEGRLRTQPTVEVAGE